MVEINFQALQEFFEPDAIEWRIQHAGDKNGRVWAICVPYVTNRAIQTRLDQVVGPENWRNDSAPAPTAASCAASPSAWARSGSPSGTAPRTPTWKA